MAKKSPYKKAKEKAWKYFSQYIRMKYADKRGFCKCVTCGKVDYWKKMQAGHFIQGRGNSVLFEERCVRVQCYSCNVMKNGNLVEYYAYMLEEVGKEEIDALRDLKYKTIKFNTVDLQELAEKYKLYATNLMSSNRSLIN